MNSRDKRASAVQFLKPFYVALPQPDGSINQADKQHITTCYRGILAGEIIPVFYPYFICLDE